MSRNERNEALWRLAVDIEPKENAPAGQGDRSEVQELRERFGDLVHRKVATGKIPESDRRR